MPEYPASVERIVYSGGASGSSSTIDGTFPPNGEVDFGWYGDFTGHGIIGFKLVLDADGVGDLFWTWDMANPGYPSSPTWTADPDASHIALHNSYDTPTSYVHVDGPTHYEHEFFWPGDPTFGGFDFNDPISDLVISLAANHASFNEVWGTLRAVFGNPGDITVSRFELVLFTAPLSPCFKTLVPTWAAGDGTGFTTNGEPSAIDTYNGPTALDLTLGVTASSVSGGTFTYHLWADYGGSPASEFIGSVDFTLDAGTPESDHVHTLTAADFTSWGTTLADVVAKFSTGAAAVFLESAGGLVYYDVWVQVGHKCRTVYPLRRHPRSDGYGLGPKRHYPPPETRRHAGGYK